MNWTASGLKMHLARIEVASARDVQIAGRRRLQLVVAAALKKIGYAHVTLDLQGYRRGSANEAIGKSGMRN